MSHTPGPWNIKTTGNVGNMVEAFSGRKLDDFDNGFRCVALFQDCTNSPIAKDQDENRLANGRLIAAAPELLEALKAIDMDEALYATYFHSPPLNPMGRVEWERRQAWLTKARAAIAKAEGK